MSHQQMTSSHLKAIVESNLRISQMQIIEAEFHSRLNTLSALRSAERRPSAQHLYHSLLDDYGKALGR